jgi:hypothetical protein
LFHRSKEWLWWLQDIDSPQWLRVSK